MDIESKTTGDPAGGSTPLALAYAENRGSLMSWLIEAGADKGALVQEFGTVLGSMYVLPCRYKVQKQTCQRAKNSQPFRLFSSMAPMPTPRTAGDIRHSLYAPVSTLCCVDVVRMLLCTDGALCQHRIAPSVSSLTEPTRTRRRMSI
jgi:hypothetical protein